METNRNSFIGVFDSGIGGLTLLPALQHLLPQEKFLYVSDDAHAPYGLKSREEILERCNIIVQALIDKGCKVIVVACNTATTNAIETLRTTYSIPFIGIEPAIKPAALNRSPLPLVRFSVWACTSRKNPGVDFTAILRGPRSLTKATLRYGYQLFC